MQGGASFSISDTKSEIIIEKSKNGEDTCSFCGKYLHSKYNPTSEGERFAQTLEVDFSPLCVFILEPALSYCAQPLKKRFPKSKIFAIRYSNFFAESDTKWDKVFYLDDYLPLSEQLFASIDEENLFSSLFFEWNASKQVFFEESNHAWNEIKKSILKARDVLGTRAYFSKRWLKNSLIFAYYLQNAVSIKKTNLPVVITSSGPSLKSSLPYLKKFRSSFFLIAVSSSFLPLLDFGINPDLVISSDGGFWAKKHLDFPKNKSDTIFALEAESAVPKSILESKKILPLIYEDGLEKDFFDAADIPVMKTERNGTVAGTALQFALNLTSEKVFLCGQDLAPAPGFQHTQPNALENDNAKKDFRLKNTETRLTRSRFNSEASLEIYRNWFITNSQRFSDRVSRISDNFKYEHSLGKIKDVNWEETEEFFSKYARENSNEGFINEKKDSKNQPAKNLRDLLLEKLNELSKTQRFIGEVFPMDAILIGREISQEKKAGLIAALNAKTEKLIEECEKIV